MAKPAVAGRLLSHGHRHGGFACQEQRKDPELSASRTESAVGPDDPQKPPRTMRLDLILQIIIVAGAIAGVISLVVQLL